MGKVTHSCAGYAVKTGVAMQNVNPPILFFHPRWVERMTFSFCKEKTHYGQSC